MSNRYEHLHYCEYRDTETGLIASNYVEVMNEQDQRIADLEAKLAESEKTNFELREKYITTLNSDVIENSRLQKEINQLKQQLAEKDDAHMKAISV